MLTAAYARRALFSNLNLGLDLPDSYQDLGAQLARRRVAAAVLGDQALHRLLKAILAQAGTALIEVLADVVAIVFRHLAVQVPVDALKYLATRRLVGLSAAHCPPSSAFARTRPRPAA